MEQRHSRGNGGGVKVLVACEFSGIVRDAFAARGHDAWSCDLLPTEKPGQHIIGDVLEVLGLGWDLMIAHPPCTYLANSGERWMKNNPERQEKRKEAVEFVRALWNAPIPRVAIENPVGHLSTAFMPPGQKIQPFYFGDPEWKTTCLWLRGLPPLMFTNQVMPDMTLGGGVKAGRISSRLHRLSPSPSRWKERSRTFPGFAQAMAEQWDAVAVDRMFNAAQLPLIAMAETEKETRCSRSPAMNA